MFEPKQSLRRSFAKVARSRSETANLFNIDRFLPVQALLPPEFTLSSKLVVLWVYRRIFRAHV